MKTILKGVDDFKTIITSDGLFIDKSLFIKEIIKIGDQTMLFPRPRRFGKSLNLSMLKYFFDNTMDSKELFTGLNIMNESEVILSHMNAYPVIHINLKETKASNYTEFIVAYKNLMSGLYLKYSFLLDSDKINNVDKEYIIQIRDKKIEGKELELALSKLIEMLRTYYDKNVVVLMDEYDAPIMESYLNGFYTEVINFMRSIFSSTFKDNTNLYKGIITGVLRVSKEGMFSDANNINIYNITDKRFSEYFGFTESEVKESLECYNLIDKFDEVKSWYDGYNFHNTTIYNPWSILNFLSDDEHTLMPYWVKTGKIDLIEKLVYKNNSNIFAEFEKLLLTGEIKSVKLDLEMDLKTLSTKEDTIWTLLMLSGYLTPTEYDPTYGVATLKIPNKEIKQNLLNMKENVFNNEFNIKLDLLDDLKYERINLLEIHFKETVMDSFSYFDTTKKTEESFYHGFTIGILYQLSNEFNIKSNRETGLGRCDILLTKKDNALYSHSENIAPGIIIGGIIAKNTAIITTIGV